MVETGGLENRFALTGNGGSNPSPSAKKSGPGLLRCISSNSGESRRSSRTAFITLTIRSNHPDARARLQ